MGNNDGAYGSFSWTLHCPYPDAERQQTRHILNRGSRQRCICYSPFGDFIENFYRPDKDVILKPSNARWLDWNLLQESPEPYHHGMLAAAIIPMAAAESPMEYKLAGIVPVADTEEFQHPQKLLKGVDRS